MRPLGLRGRFILAMLSIVLLLSTGFYLAVRRGIDVMEAQMMQRLLAEELDAYVEAYARGAAYPLPDHAGLRGYRVQDDDAGEAPARVLRLSPGLHDDVDVDGVTYMVDRRDVGDVRIYFMLDINPIERLEAQLIKLAWASLAIATVVASLVALLLARLVTRPVTELAQQLSRLDPRQRRVRLNPGRGGNRGDHEIGAIAAAFDRYAERLDEFVEREQSFTEDVSHELRTPLAVILSGAKLLEDDASLGEAARRRLDRITRATRRMQELIETLLFLSREDGGGVMGECRLDELLHDVTHDLRESMGHSPITLSLHTQPTLVKAPPALAVSVIHNLIGNALDHSAHGSVDVRLHDRSLVVEDNGQGIAPAELSRIFERRYRGRNSVGQGLGLAIVRRICEHLRWTIVVDSVPGRGTRFTLSLPAV